MAQVKVANKVFQSRGAFPRVKDARQDAAEVACLALIGREASISNVNGSSVFMHQIGSVTFSLFLIRTFQFLPDILRDFIDFDSLLIRVFVVMVYTTCVVTGV